MTRAHQVSNASSELGGYQGKAYPHRGDKQAGTGNGKNEVRVGNGKVLEPKGTTSLHAFDRKGGHSANKAEHAKTDRNLNERNEDLEVVDTGSLGHETHLLPKLHEVLLLGRVETGRLHLVHEGGIFGVLVQILHLLGLLRSAERGLEDGDSDNGGDGSEGGPPRETRVDIDVLGKPLHGRGHTPSIVEAEGLEETDLFGEVEKIAAGKLDGGSDDSIDGRGSGSGGGGIGGNGGSGIRAGRGVADLAKRGKELVGSGSGRRDAERTSYPARALGKRRPQSSAELSRRRGLEGLYTQRTVC